MFSCAGMDYLCQSVPARLEDLVDYFDARSMSRVPVVPPVYPVEIWNVYESTLSKRSWTNNLCERWNNGLLQMVGHYHPSVWTLIDALRQDSDSAIAETEIVRSQRGQPPKKRIKRCIIALQECLLKICHDCATGEMSVAQALSVAAHTIRFK